jgi:hypothetical protein
MGACCAAEPSGKEQNVKHDELELVPDFDPYQGLEYDEYEDPAGSYVYVPGHPENEFPVPQRTGQMLMIDDWGAGNPDEAILPMTAKNIIAIAEEACMRGFWFARCPEMGDPESFEVLVEDCGEFYEWGNFLDEIHGCAEDDPGIPLGSFHIDSEVDVYVPGIGWTEDEHGGAEFIPFG